MMTYRQPPLPGKVASLLHEDDARCLRNLGTSTYFNVIAYDICVFLGHFLRENRLIVYSYAASKTQLLQHERHCPFPYLHYFYNPTVVNTLIAGPPTIETLWRPAIAFPTTAGLTFPLGRPPSCSYSPRAPLCYTLYQFRHEEDQSVTLQLSTRCYSTHEWRATYGQVIQSQYNKIVRYGIMEGFGVYRCRRLDDVCHFLQQLANYCRSSGFNIDLIMYGQLHLVETYLTHKHDKILYNHVRNLFCFIENVKVN